MAGNGETSSASPEHRAESKFPSQITPELAFLTLVPLSRPNEATPQCSGSSLLI